MEQLKKKLYEDIKKTIEKWGQEDIYAISFFVSQGEEEVKKPGVAVGYNTESNYRESISFAKNKDEARWDFSFWLQNIEYEFGYTPQDIEMTTEWLKEKELAEHKEDDAKNLFYFNLMLQEIAIDMHKEGFLREHFKKDMPIRIHDFEFCYFTIKESDVFGKKKGDTDFMVDIFSRLKN